MNTIVVIGAGHAGGSVVAFLRQFGHAGPVVLIGCEPIAPYQRPPLSKAFLKGDVGIDSLKLRPDAFYGDKAIDFRPGTIVEAIDAEAKTVSLQSGEQLAYDKLIIATGARARPLDVPGAQLKNVMSLRSAADAEALKLVLRPGARIAIVGAGYVGLEAAASAIALGASVVVIEREARVLARVASEPLSSFFQNFHQAQGAEIVCNEQVVGFEGDGTGVSGVRLAGGRLIDCDAAIVGIGAIANDELAREAGLACSNGIIVDGAAQTSDPNIFAIGDVTFRPAPIYDNQMLRIESVPNALEQARLAACAIAGRPSPAPEVPWFWSDQYDLKLQIAGIPIGADAIVVRRHADDAKLAVFHLRGRRLLAVEAVNAPAEFMVGKQLIASRKAIVPENLANPNVSMKEIGA
jgi:3-phenylpropionate/trans-cinnamate dioxygenase ferredoxin reductase subunit